LGDGARRLRPQRGDHDPPRDAAGGRGDVGERFLVQPFVAAHLDVELQECSRPGRHALQMGRQLAQQEAGCVGIGATGAVAEIMAAHPCRGDLADDGAQRGRAAQRRIVEHGRLRIGRDAEVDLEAGHDVPAEGEVGGLERRLVRVAAQHMPFQAHASSTAGWVRSQTGRGKARALPMRARADSPGRRTAPDRPGHARRAAA